MIKMRFTRRLKPDTINVYRRAGAAISEAGTGTEITFNTEALRRFYLNDVLMHEIGHHNDHQLRAQRKREGFAEWFAIEYGHKLTDNYSKCIQQNVKLKEL